MDWIERAEKELEDALENGEITYEEYSAAQKDLCEEVRDNARCAADEAYDMAMGGY